ncbi:MAG: Cof-type HAD-IIB family hydrolase [Cytophagales bacterium]|nr:Cof-type HAD-IIB family hydrolase [Cytophagales bacterium]
MKYKMLVLDLDDTLLNDSHEISLRNRQKLLEAQESGTRVVLASGRPTAAMVRFANELELKKFGSHILSYNGAVILDMATEETLFEQSLTKDEIHVLFDHAEEFKLHILTYLDGDIITQTRSKYIDIEEQITGMPLKTVPDFKASVYKSAIKCLLLEEPDYLQKVHLPLAKRLPHLSITTSKPFFLEVTQRGIDKAASLERLGKLLGIGREEIIAVGNAGNDLSMVEYAGLGVWVDNVAPELRHIADVIVASNNDDGVAEVVDRYILSQS